MENGSSKSKIVPDGSEYSVNENILHEYKNRNNTTRNSKRKVNRIVERYFSRAKAVLVAMMVYLLKGHFVTNKPVINEPSSRKGENCEICLENENASASDSCCLCSNGAYTCDIYTNECENCRFCSDGGMGSFASVNSFNVPSCSQFVKKTSKIQKPTISRENISEIWKPLGISAGNTSVCQPCDLGPYRSASHIVTNNTEIQNPSTSSNNNSEIRQPADISEKEESFCPNYFQLDLKIRELPDAEDKLTSNEECIHVIRNKSESRLEKLLKISERGSDFIESGEFDKGYEVLESQIGLGENASFIHVLINHYIATLTTGRLEESYTIQQELTKLIGDTFKATDYECEEVANKYKTEGKHLHAILFYQIASDLSNLRSSSGQSINCLLDCMNGMNESCAEILNHNSSLRTCICAVTNMTLQKIKDKIVQVQEIQLGRKVVVEALALHHIGTWAWLTGDYFDEIQILQKVIAVLEEKLGTDEAVKYKLYGSTFNNLASAYLMVGDLSKALDFYQKSLSAKSKTVSFSSQREKYQSVFLTRQAIAQTQEMLTYMNMYQADNKSSMYFNALPYIEL